MSNVCRRDRFGGCGIHGSIWPEGSRCRVAQGNPSGSYDYGLPATAHLAVEFAREEKREDPAAQASEEQAKQKFGREVHAPIVHLSSQTNAAAPMPNVVIYRFDR
jgi:hypothetical protein